MKKVCVVTAARSDYGLLHWVIDGLCQDPSIELQLVATGAHLVEDQGFTYTEIEADGYPIAQKIDMELDTSSTHLIGRSMGVCGERFAEAFDLLKPDLLVVLGDRYELLPICSTALVMGIPIAHISGGDVTEGAIDDAVRNAVTMMADIHFAGNEESAKNIERMRHSANEIYNVGEPGLDNFNHLELMSRSELSENLSIDPAKKWGLLTYHPETRLPLEKNLEAVKDIIESLRALNNVEVVITKANADFGGVQINDYLQGIAQSNPQKFSLHTSLGQKRYLSFIKQASLVIGNSSSGIIEAPFCGIPVVNVGDRQTGRYMCQNVTQARTTVDSIRGAIGVALEMDCRNISDRNYYGDGHSTDRIVEQIKNFLQ